MIEIVGDFHTHTRHSHGKGSIEDNVKAAIDRGLVAVAISDHGVSKRFNGIPDMDAYLREIEEIRDKYAGKIKVYSGYEGNLQSLQGMIDIPEGYADEIDIPSFGYHRIVRYPNPADWVHFMSTVMSKHANEGSKDKNTAAMTSAIIGNPIVYVTHPGYGLHVDKQELARVAAENDVVLEINAKHPEFTVNELSDAADAGVMFIVNSDAHSPERVGDFATALHKIEKAGIAPSQIVNSAENIDAFLEKIERRRRGRGPRSFGSVLHSVKNRQAQ